MTVHVKGWSKLCGAFRESVPHDHIVVLIRRNPTIIIMKRTRNFSSTSLASLLAASPFLAELTLQTSTTTLQRKFTSLEFTKRFIYLLPAQRAIKRPAYNRYISLIILVYQVLLFFFSSVSETPLSLVSQPSIISSPAHLLVGENRHPR